MPWTRILVSGVTMMDMRFFKRGGRGERREKEVWEKWFGLRVLRDLCVKWIGKSGLGGRGNLLLAVGFRLALVEGDLVAVGIDDHEHPARREFPDLVLDRAAFLFRGGVLPPEGLRLVDDMPCPA